MRTIKGYRLGPNDVGDVGRFIEGLRADSLRILARHYSKAIAEEAVRILDLHSVGLEPKPPEQSPIKDAISELRNRVAQDLDCRIAFHFVEDVVLLRIISGLDLYRTAVESRPGISSYDWVSDAADGPEDWIERGRLWNLAHPSPRLGSSLKFQLIDGPMPAPRWSSVKRWLPEINARVSKVAQARLWQKSPFFAQEDRAGFRKHLQTPAGAKALEQSTQYCRLRMKRDIEREDLIQYGQRRSPATRPSRPAPTISPLMPRLIDHADILETIDGRVFVAIPYAGLSINDRVFVQIVDRTLSFVQLGKDYGQIGDVSNLALDLLRDLREVTLVELAGDISKKAVKAKHIALVSDISPAREYASGIQRWKNNANPASRRNTEWIENE